MKYANRMNRMVASEIREILKVTEQEQVISFAGGLPAPELFPVENFLTASKIVLEKNGHQALQYSTTEGFEPLRQQIADRINEKFQSQVRKNEILMVNGAQQALDMSGKLFLNKGDTVVCESPTYLGAINAFKAYECQFNSVSTDDQGICLSHLKEVLDGQDDIKLIYVIPDFQNPTGRRWSLKKREEFMQLVSQYNIPVIEDNPYGEISFDNQIFPSLKKWDVNKQVVTLGTFSKIFCPGLRIGWIAASQEIINQYILLKQSADLHTSNLSQRQISKYLELFDIEAHILKLIQVYKLRRDVAVAAIQKSFPPQIRYTFPEGGLFLWVELPEGLSSRSLFDACIEKNVAFVPGDAFYPNGEKKNAFRLNFSNASEEQLQEGISRIGSIMVSYFS